MASKNNTPSRSTRSAPPKGTSQKGAPQTNKPPPNSASNEISPAINLKCKCDKPEPCNNKYSGGCKQTVLKVPSKKHEPAFWDGLNADFGTNIAFNKIAEFETTTASPIVPSGTSGMTVGTGADFKEKDICNKYKVGDKTYELSEDLKNKLRPCLCKQGACACECVKEHPFTLTDVEINELDAWSKAQQVTEMERMWKSSKVPFKELPEEFQTVIFSRKYQSGTNLYNVGFGNKVHKKKMNVHYRSFVENVQNGNYKEAIHYFEEIEKLNPSGRKKNPLGRIQQEYEILQDYLKRK